MAQWNHSGSKVASGASPTSWNSLDLAYDTMASPTGFSGRGLALLKVIAYAGNPYVGFRPMDDSGDWYFASPGGHGVCCARVNSALLISALILVPTNGDSKVEWMSSSSVSIDVYLLGWIDAEYDLVQVFTDNNLPSSWTDLEIDEITGLVNSFNFFAFRQTGGTVNEVATRPDGDTTDWIDNSAGAIGAASQGNSGAIGKTLALTQASTLGKGAIEIIADTTVPNGYFDLIMHEVEGWYVDGAKVYSMAAPPGVWTQLNLSTQMYSKRGLAVIKIERDSSKSGTMVGFGFRTNGDTSDYLDPALTEPAGAGTCVINASESTLVLVETDATGIFQWKSTDTGCQCELTLVGYLSENEPAGSGAPYPVGSSFEPNVVVKFGTMDDTQVVQSSIQMTLTDPDGNNIPVITNGVFQGSYNGTILANATNGYNITVSTHPNFVVGEWTAFGSCLDQMGKGGSVTWNFEIDTNDPVVSDQYPSGVVTEQFDRIFCRITDPYGIDTSTIGFTASSTSREKLTGIIAGSFQSGWSGSITTEASGTVVNITITQWPDLADIRTWMFEVTGQSNVGKAI